MTVKKVTKNNRCELIGVPDGAQPLSEVSGESCEWYSDTDTDTEMLALVKGDSYKTKAENCEEDQTKTRGD